MNRYICIHGHFYQPPRENPWLEEIEQQESSYPFKNWNERITSECYAPNTAARILDHDKIVEIVNNYSKISFNFGPTLLSWMERHNPKVYQAILDADKESRKNFSGHGAAIAQVYNHVIMPLANERDKHTQVIWGIRDFEHRFKRKPEGMWLAETAVDVETLEVLAEHGVKFTILAPRQAMHVRRIGEAEWHDVSGEKVDTRFPYLCKLPSGASISLFFYDGMISRDLAFGGLAYNGESMGRRLHAVFSGAEQNQPIIAHVATDGETYGHHHRHGDRALAYCLYFVKKNHLARITIYGEYLKLHPPTHEAEIIENTSWSCYHGVERWRRNCGCNSGRPGWSQTWREPLRNGLDWLRDELVGIYEREAGAYFSDPWKSRNDYIDVILDRSEDNIGRFFMRNIGRELSHEEKTRVIRLCEMQRNALLMYTSCGWFFDEVSGIETVQIMQYAARAIQLAKEISGIDLEPGFLQYLEKAPSNVPELKNGAKIYQILVKTLVVDLYRVGAHFAILTLFNEHDGKANIYSYSASCDLCDREEKGVQKLVVGRVKLSSTITLDQKVMMFVALHLGDHNLYGGIAELTDEAAFEQMKQEIREVFHRSNAPEVVQRINHHFGANRYSLWHLFRDESCKVFDRILESKLQEIESYFRKIYEEQYPIMVAMSEMRAPLPKSLKAAAEFTINTDLRRLLEREELNMEHLEKNIEDVSRFSLDLDGQKLELIATEKINNLVDKLKRTPEETSLLEKLCTQINMLGYLPLQLDFWYAQNELYRIACEFYDNKRVDAEAGDQAAQAWILRFNELADGLKVKI